MRSSKLNIEILDSVKDALANNSIVVIMGDVLLKSEDIILILKDYTKDQEINVIKYNSNDVSNIPDDSGVIVYLTTREFTKRIDLNNKLKKYTNSRNILGVDINHSKDYIMSIHNRNFNNGKISFAKLTEKYENLNDYIQGNTPLSIDEGYNGIWIQTEAGATYVK